MKPASAKPIFKTDTLELLSSPERIRVKVGGQTIANSKAAVMLFEKGHMPLYYLLETDLY